MVKSLILNCRLTKYRSQNNRPSLRTSISQISQRCSLINQRGRRILYHQMCFHVSFFPCCLWMLIGAILGFDQHSHAHTFSLSYCAIKEQRRLFASADFYCEILSDWYIHKNGVL